MIRAIAIAAAVAAMLACDRAVAPSPAAPPTGPASEAPVPAKSDGATDDAEWRGVPRDRLCVTSGTLTPLGRDRLLVDAPTLRAVAAWTTARAELAFTYEGPTSSARALGSGEMRRQLGLKLRAQDACNLVYVMWRVDGDGNGTLAVQVKRNAGQRRSAECQNRGYRSVAPRAGATLPRLVAGAAHVLRAEADGAELRVVVDDTLAWNGTLPASALEIEGPIGLRSDNVRFEGELLAAGGEAKPCASGRDDD